MVAGQSVTTESLTDQRLGTPGWCPRDGDAQCASQDARDVFRDLRWRSGSHNRHVDGSAGPGGGDTRHGRVRRDSVWHVAGCVWEAMRLRVVE